MKSTFFCTNHVHKNERSGQTDDKVLFKVCYQAAVLSCVERNSVQLEHSLKHRQTFTVSLFKVFVTFNFQKNLWPTLHEIGMRVHVVYLIFQECVLWLGGTHRQDIILVVGSLNYLHLDVSLPACPLCSVWSYWMTFLQWQTNFARGTTDLGYWVFCSSLR